MSERETQMPPAVPLDRFAGKWIVWDNGRTRIVASGNTLEEAVAAGGAAGEGDPIYEKLPKASRWLGAIG